jgi:hypothetical protein
MKEKTMTTMQSTLAPRRLPATSLRSVLAFDAASCFALGALLVALPATLSGWFGLPQALLFWAGLLLLPSAALMIGLAAMRSPHAGLTRLVIAGNVAWVLASLAVPIVLAPTGLGLAFVLGQAAAVLALLVLEQRALRSA